MTFVVATDHVNISGALESFDVNAGNSTALYTLVSQYFQLLLWFVVESDWAITAADNNEIFKSSYTVGNALCNANISVKAICYFIE